jgi:hypothetical protein
VGTVVFEEHLLAKAWGAVDAGQYKAVADARRLTGMATSMPALNV